MNNFRNNLPSLALMLASIATLIALLTLGPQILRLAVQP